MSYFLHLGIEPTVNGQASFMGWTDPTRELRIGGLTYLGAEELETFDVLVSGSWEVWGVDDQQGHRSLHLEVPLGNVIDNATITGAVLAVQVRAVGQVYGLALITTEVSSEKTHVVDLTMLPAVYVYALPSQNLTDTEAMDQLRAFYGDPDSPLNGGDLVEFVGSLLHDTGR